LQHLENKDIRIFQQKIRFQRMPYFFGFTMLIQYIVWQFEISALINSGAIGDYDLAHHVSWGSLNLGTGLSKTKGPYVIGPCGGGTMMIKGGAKYLGVNLITEGIRVITNACLQHSKWSQRSVERASVVLVTNSDAYRLAMSMGGKRIETSLSEGIESTEIRARFQMPNSLDILWVGRFLPIKAANLAIEAFREVVNDFPDARLVMVGDGPQKKKAEFLVTKYGLDKKVVFTGKISWREVQELYLSARVLLFSSVRDSTGAQVLEAAAKGLPVVTCNGLGVTEWIQSPARVSAKNMVNDSIVSSLHKDLVHALNMPEREWISASTSANKYAEFHNWHNKQEEVNRMYINILGNSM
jgi:glycosyltransferase involved in cell wall biosynthesis